MAAGPFEGLGPTVVEYIFAHRMRFEEKRHHADRRTGIVLEHDMLRQPTGAPGCTAGLLERQKKPVVEEGIVGLARGRWQQTIPDTRRNRGCGRMDLGV